MANLCTDAGHGGKDSGASWGGVLEKDVNLACTLALNETFKSRGHSVMTTRRSDANVPSLAARCKLINAHHTVNAPHFDAIISIHCNVAATLDQQTGGYKPLESVRGFYAIYSQEAPASINLATAIAQQCKAGGVIVKDDGKISTVQLGRSLAWIHKTLPTAVLLEIGFLTNPEENRLLADEAHRRKLITAIADGIDQFLKS